MKKTINKNKQKMKLNETYIFLSNVKFYARHGVGAQETLVGNTFIIDLRLKLNFSQAAENDDLNHTVSYADVFKAVKAEMKIPSMLLEHVGARIVKRLFQDFPIVEAIDLKLAKQNPPMGADIDCAGVEFHCER
ncbi:dihydroneopterin aldolase [Bacteroides sedimenti]|uniref:7,8-dihydroneopterin aldolase n=1 Tax=Bacteroides sedimenti TaxID=2136147 RepID=A0ABM8IF78_9BACE